MSIECRHRQFRCDITKMMDERFTDTTMSLCKKEAGLWWFMDVKKCVIFVLWI